MKVTCIGCRKDFKIADPAKLNNTRHTITFTCPGCGKKEVLSKGEALTWSRFFELRALASEQETARPASLKPPRMDPMPEAVVDAPARPKAQASPPGPVEIPADAPPRRRSLFSGLTGKVVLFMLLVSLLPLSIYALVLNHATIQRMEAETDLIGQQITKGLAAQVDEWTDKNLRILQAASLLADMESMNPLRQEPVLKAIAFTYPWKYLVFTIDANGMNLARSDGQPLTDYSDRQYYKDVVLDQKSFAWQTLIGRTTRKPALILAVPIRREGRLVGALCSAMHVEAISDQIVNWRKGKTGFAFLVDQTGKVVAHQIEEFSRTAKALNNHPLVANFDAKQVGMQRFEEAGAARVGFVRRTEWGWKVATQQDESEVFELIRQANFFALILLGLTVILVLVVAVLSGRTIVKPIKRLTETAEKISTGDLEVDIDVKSKNEIGELATAIARMQDSIRIAMERLRRTRSAKPRLVEPDPSAHAVDVKQFP
ncbi:MAG: HAMP domain-containing protein [Desulfobacterales bacterium]|jgi:methyl-accepting chemotaxis protein|nr:HAMP domain-containing protein [Desulfobacterales bacterium]